jgi:hypothetical protein
VSGWEIAAPVMVGVLLLGLLIFSVLKPSSVVRFGIFIERKLLEKEPPAPPEPTSPADEDTKEIRRDPDSW